MKSKYEYSHGWELNVFSTAANNFIFMYTLMVEVTQCKQTLLTGSFSVSTHGFECVRLQQCGLGHFVFLLEDNG